MTHSNQSNENVLLLICGTVMLKQMFRVHCKISQFTFTIRDDESYASVCTCVIFLIEIWLQSDK